MRKINNKIIKIEARLSRVLFPKYPEILGKGDNTYGIVSWNPMLVLEGEIQTDSWGSIVVKGNYEEEIDPSVAIAGAALCEIGRMYEFEAFPSMRRTKRGWLVPTSVDSILYINYVLNGLKKEEKLI